MIINSSLWFLVALLCSNHIMYIDYKLKIEYTLLMIIIWYKESLKMQG